MGSEVFSSTNDFDGRRTILSTFRPKLTKSSVSRFNRRRTFESSYWNGKSWGLPSRRRPEVENKTEGPERIDGKSVEKVRFAERLLKRCKTINDQNLYAIPLINSTSRRSTFNRFYFGNPDGQAEHRTILVLGSSQAKFINGVINFIFNVDQKDIFRFQLINEEETVHSTCITVYDIHYSKGFRIPYSMTFVVTPCFVHYEDSGKQILKDQKIAEIIHEFLQDSDGIKELDMICNVMMDCSINRSIWSIFGKDVAGNTNTWRPFTYLGDAYLWKEIYQRFFALLTKKKRKSLSLTKEVIKERKKIEEAVKELESLFEIGQSKLKEMKKTNQMIIFCKKQIECNEEVEDNFFLQCKKKVKLPIGEYVNNCNRCYITCYSLPIKNQNEDLGCSFNSSDLHKASKITDFCSVCPKKCSMNEHSNQPYRWVGVNKGTMNLTDYTFQRNAASMKWRDIKLKGQHVIAMLQKDLVEHGKLTLELFKNTWRCIQRLNEIALNGNSSLTQRFFDLIFDAEQQLKELGFHLQGYEI